MSQTNPASRADLEGGLQGNQLVGFPEGVDSFNSPLLVKPTQVRWLVNAVTSGAVIQTRPGYKERLAFILVPDSGQPYYDWWTAAGKPVIHPQMATIFQPSFGGPQLVFAVSGSVWYCPINDDGSFGASVFIESLPFSVYASQMTWAKCVQTSTIVSGVYANNQAPRNLLILQDGVNRAGIWDGMSGVKMNPIKKFTTDSGGNTLFTAGYNETRIGQWMAWSGNRLWVFNGPLGFASDLGDPTHFTEEMFLNSWQVFVFPEAVTGAIDRGTSGTGRSQVVVTTHTTTWTLWSGIQARLPSANAAGWVNTPDFMVKIFSAVGCVSGKSLIVHRGLLYWQSADGIVLFDSTQTVYSTQNLPPIDQEMTYSKRRMSPNVSGTCAGIRESYVFWSVPVGPVTNGRNYNGHTQVLDRQTTVVRSVGLDGPFSYGTTGWQGVWTGMRPVEWTTGNVGGRTRTYALSMDLDGVVRVWEAFQGNRADNGAQIPWQIETRAHPVGQSLFDQNNFNYFRLLLDQVLGNLSVQGAWRGMRGIYKQILSTTVTATPGQVLAPYPGNESPYTNASGGESFTSQTRDIRSPSVRGPQDQCSSAGVESPLYDVQDRAFSLWLQFKGRGAILAYRIAVDNQAEKSEGEVMESETGFHILPENNCPQFVEGQTPDYMLADAPLQKSFIPVSSKLPETDSYAAPPL